MDVTSSCEPTGRLALIRGAIFVELGLTDLDGIDAEPDVVVEVLLEAPRTDPSYERVAPYIAQIAFTR